MHCGICFRTLVAVGAAAVPVWPNASPAVERDLVELIAVEPNTGGSSGGHTGLRIGGSVYHFMAGSMDSLLLLYRVTWADFQERYCELENRGLSLTRLAVNPAAARKIEDHLKHLLAIQDKHLARLRALDAEHQWLATMAGTGEPPELPGRGFFAGEGDTVAADLRSRLSGTLGADFVAAELARVEAELREASSTATPAAEAGVDSTRFPTPVEIPAENLLELLTLREALLNIQLARGLDAAHLRSPDDTPLSGAERRMLLGHRDGLEKAIARLLRSPRPDRGKPLMLATARWQAMQRSLAENRFLFLDSFPPTNAYLDPDESRQHRRLLEALRELTADGWSRARAEVFTGSELGEFDFHRLEVAASRAAELRDATKLGKPVRITGAVRQIPGLPGAATPLELDADRGAIGTAAAESQAAYQSYSEGVDEAYGFKLIKHNCATELAAMLLSAFPDEAAAAEALGGIVRPGDGLSAIPLSLTGEARERWNVASESSVPSRRKREVAKQLNGGHRPLLTRLRESNRVTSTVYPGSIDDDAFLFFADGRRVLRPLQGAANLTYGLGHTGVGVLTSPFDKGRRVSKGLRGMVWSVPEVIGISIRRGHYDMLPAEED